MRILGKDKGFSAFEISGAPYIPSKSKLGFGTENLREQDLLREYLREVNKVGYDFIDCAWRYGNEPYIGMALKDLKKEDMSFEFKVPFQSKVWPTKFAGGINKSIKFALAKIGANDYLDSYLLHAPANEESKNISAWKQLIDCRKRGQTKKIGLGDFSIAEIESLFKNTDTMPDILQLPLNINDMHSDYYAYCREKGIELQSYRPFGDYEKNKANEKLIELAKKYNTTIKNLLIAYLLNIGVTVIAMPENKEEIAEFPKAKSIVLDSKDIEILNNLN